MEGFAASLVVSLEKNPPDLKQHFSEMWKTMWNFPAIIFGLHLLLCNIYLVYKAILLMKRFLKVYLDFHPKLGR